MSLEGIVDFPPTLEFPPGYGQWWHWMPTWAQNFVFFPGFCGWKSQIPQILHSYCPLVSSNGAGKSSINWYFNGKIIHKFVFQWENHPINWYFNGKIIQFMGGFLSFCSYFFWMVTYADLPSWLAHPPLMLIFLIRKYCCCKNSCSKTSCIYFTPLVADLVK